MNNRSESVRGEEAGRRATSMRNQARSMAEKRKQEYLGARVPKGLREKILMRADILGIPVSILIRNILTDYIECLGDEGSAIKRATLVDGSDVSKRRHFDEVVGWEKLTLNKEMVCESCAKQLNKGDKVVFGMVPGARHVILCEQCQSLDGTD